MTQLSSRAKHSYRPQARAAIALGRTAGRLSRALRRGTGSVIAGHVGMRVHHGLLEELTAWRPVAFVSGTNGKTTTTGMLRAALATKGPVACNQDGANLLTGVLAGLMSEPRAGMACLEADEFALAQILPRVPHATVVLLNLSRDQLDRYTEVGVISDRWQQMLEKHRGTVVANADDPLVVRAAYRYPDVIWVATAQPWLLDARVCRQCGHPLAFTADEWHCTSCDLKRPQPAWSLVGDDLVSADGTCIRLQLRLPGRANRANAVTAAAAASVFGVPAADAVNAISQVGGVAGRYDVITLGGRQVQLLLAKNPAGWQEALDIVNAEGVKSVVTLVNSRTADGFDVSWLWDVPFEMLAGCSVVAGGERRFDLAARLRYADVDCISMPNLSAAVASLPPGPTTVIANYTAFRDLTTHAN